MKKGKILSFHSRVQLDRKLDTAFSFPPLAIGALQGAECCVKSSPERCSLKLVHSLTSTKNYVSSAS